MQPKHQITTFPRPRLIRRELITTSLPSNLAAFSSLHPLGRAALYWAFRSLGSTRGSVAWFAPYHCGVEVQAAIEAGFDPRFYRLHSDLSVNEDDLISRVEKAPGPIVLAHYFGFAQPAVARLASLCDQRGWIMIEDCAHALFSGDGSRQLGDYGQMAFYSFRKTLPTFEGAALKISSDDRQRRYHPVLKGRSVSASGRFLRADISRMMGEGCTARIRIFLGRDGCDPAVLVPESLEFGSWRNERISLVSRRLLGVAKPADIVTQRRKNYETLDRLLSEYEGYQKIFSHLAPGVCPLSMPIRVSNRPEMLRRLFACGIHPYVFGAYPHPNMPLDFQNEARWMRDCIVTLPVHQELNESEILQVADAVGPLLRRHVPEDRCPTAESTPIGC